MDLRARLDRLREEARQRQAREAAREPTGQETTTFPPRTSATPPTGAGDRPAHGTLAGREEGTAFGPVFYRDTWHPLDHRHGAVPLRRLLDVPAPALAQLGRDPRLASVPPQRLAFIDTETTGLAGGTGTVAFLIGVGLYRDGAFLVRQYFLRDFSEEPAALAHLSRLLAGGPGRSEADAAAAVVSFNGKSFDLPLLETRYLLQRSRSPLRELPHLDLLHPARRIFRQRLGDCSLATLEAAVLGHAREGDVPGHLIPSLYFEYLRSREAGPIETIIEHNRQDLLALVGLGADLARAVHDPRAWDAPAPDFIGLGRICEDLGRLDDAAACYEAALERGADGPSRRRALRCLALLRKRRQEHDAAASAWTLLHEHAPSVEALVELAKHYEHRARNYAAAIEVTRRALDLAAERRSWGVSAPGTRGGAADVAALRHRLARLERKQARARRSAVADLLEFGG